MKILMLTSSFDIGGAETHILELSKSLTRLGNKVVIASGGGEYVKSLKKYGIEHYTVPINSKKPFCILSSYLKLKELLKENNFDIIHSHARLPSFISHFLSKTEGVPFVTTAHWVFSVRQPYKALSFWGEKTLSVSADIKNYLIDNYKINPENIVITENGIDTDSFCAKKIPEEAKRIIHVSRLDEGRAKTAFALLSIAKDLHSFSKNIKIEIVGCGNCEEKLRQKADEINLELKEEVVILHGKRTDVDVLLSSGGGIFVGVSRASLEAMSCSYPVILSGDEGYGGIFDAKNPEKAMLSNFCCRGDGELREKTLFSDIVYLLSNKEIALLLGKSNRLFIERHYSSMKMAQDALSVYKSVLKKKSSSRVIICGYYGYGNIGDEATLTQTVKSLKRQNINDITVLSKRPRKTAKANGVKAIYRYNIFSIIRCLLRADAFLLGGGNLLQNQTSNRSLYYYGSLLMLAKKMGARCFSYSSGIGALHGEREIAFAKEVLSLCEKITVRTESDKSAIKSLLKKANVFTTSDAVFLYENGNFSYLDLKYSFLKEKKYAIFALREPRKDRKRWAEELSSAISRLYKEESILPIFIPFHKKKDEKITKEIIKRVGCGMLVNALCSDEVVYLLKGALFSSGMRMHLMIFSMLAETPHLLLSYDKKCEDMLLHLKNKADELNLSGNFLKRVENGYFDGFSSILNECYDKSDMQALCEYMRKGQINFF